MSKTIIIEGRYDSTTTKVVKDIMTVIMKSKDYPSGDQMVIDLPHHLDGTDEYYLKRSDIEFSVELHVKRTVTGTFIIESHKANDDDDTMIIAITLNENEEPGVYEDMYMKLQEDVRHELEHLLQDLGRGDVLTPENGVDNDETTYEHHSRIQEVPAMVQGFYRRAKKMRLPLDEIMTQDLDSEIEQGNLTPEEAKDLLRIWMLYSKRRLPKAIYTNQ